MQDDNRGMDAERSSHETDLLRRRALGAVMSLVAFPLVACGGGGGGGSSDAESASEPEPEPRPKPDADPGEPIGPDMAVRTYSARWSHTLVPEKGALPVWTSGFGAGTPTLQDCYGRLRHAKRGEARFWGARRVQNKLQYSADMTQTTAWSSVGTATVQLVADGPSDSTGGDRTFRLAKTSTNSARLQVVGVLPAVPHTFSVYARAETLTEVYIQIYVQRGAVLTSGIFTLNRAGWTRVQVSGVPDGVNSYRVMISPGPFVSGAAGSILVCDAQLEDVSGHPSPAASEYVATNRPSPAKEHYGAMVDGVRYFDTVKGNTVMSGVVTSAEGRKISGTVLRHLRLEPQSVNLCTESESFASWSNLDAAVTLTQNAGSSPFGDNSAVLMTDTTANINRFIGHGLGRMAAQTPIFISCFAKMQSARWLRLGATLSDGVTVLALFDLQAGEVGALLRASGRPCWSHIERWGDGWMRCVLITQNSAGGAGEPVMQIGMATADSTISYTGGGSSLLIWGGHAAPVEYAPSYIPNPASSGVATRESQSLELPNPGSEVIGQQSFVVAMDVFPTYYTGVTIKGGVTPTWRSLWYAFAEGTARQQNRLGLGLRPNTVSFFGDRYLGDPNSLYYWRPNTSYPAGAVVIPTDTELNNDNLRKMFICVVAGISGTSEPVWNTTFVPKPDTTTAITSDGTVRWQNNHDNNFQGQWEPYDTSVLDAGFHVYASRVAASDAEPIDVAAVRAIRSSYFSSPGAYGYAVNGTNASLKTRPFPIDGSAGGDLHLPMQSLRFGRLNEGETAHPISVGNLFISRESLDYETNRLRSVIATV